MGIASGNNLGMPSFDSVSFSDSDVSILFNPPGQGFGDVETVDTYELKAKNNVNIQMTVFRSNSDPSNYTI